VTNWKEISHRVQERIKNVGRSSGKSRSQPKSKIKNESKHKKKEISPQEAVALTASIIIIIMALGGIGLVYNVFAQLE
jgi:chemotaxis response regulator CheB